jgi:NAD(P) transhydrogenase subunit alpha
MLKELGGQESFNLDLENEVIRGSLVTHEHQITWPPPAKPAAPTAAVSSNVSQVAAKTANQGSSSFTKKFSALFLIIFGAAVLFGLGMTAPDSFLAHLTIFVLACFIGWQVIWNVAPALHTPLMSVTNAISGIIIVGGMMQIAGPLDSLPAILGALAIFIGTINISGGFLVTQRMLRMFRR